MESATCEEEKKECGKGRPNVYMQRWIEAFPYTS